MANTVYDKARDNFAQGKIAWISDPGNTAYGGIRVVLVDANVYVANFATDDALNDIPAGARLSDVALTGRTTSGDGIVRASNPVFPLVTGAEAEAMVIYQRGLDGSSNPVEASSLLIAYIDTAPGLPVQPNGTDINVTFSPVGIFKL